MNTRINFLYRDASNYKIYQQAVIEGELSEDQIQDILDARHEGEWFLPSVVGLDAERFSEETEDDHPWFELSEYAFEATNDHVTSDVTAEEFYERFMEASEDWESYVDSE